MSLHFVEYFAITATVYCFFIIKLWYPVNIKTLCFQSFNLINFNMFYPVKYFYFFRPL